MMRPSATLLCVGMAAASSSPAFAQTIDSVAATPASVTRNVATDVLFTARITDPRVIAGGVNLLKTDASGRTLATVGTLRDDGTNGDALAGDQVFSAVLSIRETTVGAVYYRVSAAFERILRRTLSDLMRVDVTGGTPSISVSLSPSPNTSGWHNTDVSVRFTCAPDGAAIVSCGPDRVVSTEGAAQVVVGTAVDAVGVEATVSVTLNVDLTPPTIAVRVEPDPGPGGVHTGPVTVRFECADALSGLASCEPAHLLDTPGMNQTVTGIVVDRAGNTATIVSPPISIVTDSLAIKDFSPKSAPAGTLVTLSGTSLAPNPRVTLARLGGGTIEAQVASVSTDSLAFVIPPGAATGPVGVTVGGGSVASAAPLVIVSSTTFGLDVQPPAVTAIAGQSVSVAVSVSSESGFTQSVALGVSGVPPGVTATFVPATITAGQTSILTLSSPSGQPPRTTSLLVSASATVEGLPQTQDAQVDFTEAEATTSLLGRIVVADTDEVPIAGVTVKMLGKNGNGGTTSCRASTVSDAAGNFALTNLDTGCVGPQLVGYDGLTATSPPGDYAGVNLVYTLKPGEATVSPVLVHLPRIDDKETFNVQQNAPVDQTYAYKSIPGLSVTVYAGTTFTLDDGSRPDPFPLVAVQVPVDRLPDAKPPVPTMLSAFIVAFQPANAVASQPAAVFYPNTLKTAPGVNMTMMTLDPTLGRMVPYGTATVSAGGSQIVPDLDPAYPGHRYGIVNFDWHGPMPPPPPPPEGEDPVNEVNPGPGAGGCGGGGGGGPERGGPEDGGPEDGGCEHSQECGACQTVRDGLNPVDLGSGLETVVRTDLAIRGGLGAISIQRYYRTLSRFAGPFGIGTHHNYGYRLDRVNVRNAELINLVTPDGNRFPFTRERVLVAADGRPPAPDVFLNFTDAAMFGAVMTAVSDANIELRWKDGTIYRFASPQPQFTPQLSAIVDPNGSTITIIRNPNNANQVTRITDPAGRSLMLSYDGANRVTEVTDPIGRAVKYTYNAQGTLETVTDAEGGITRYEYDAANRLVREFNARKVLVTENTYDADGRVIQQVAADGATFTYAYTKVNPLVPASPLLSTTVTDPLKRQREYRFNTNGYPTDIRRADGLKVVTERDPRTNQAVGQLTVGMLVAKTVLDRDDRGNIIRRTDSYGRTTTYERHPEFNGVTAVTNALGHRTSFDYDDRGNLVSRTDANGNVTTYRYDGRGQLIETIDALKQTTRFAYDLTGNLISTTDALGNVTRFGCDGISRLIETVDPLGRRTRTEYDRLSRVVKQIDGRGNATSFTYDELGNLTAVTDARGKRTSFVYDVRNRLIERIDPLGRSDRRTYDLAGNLISYTDRRGLTSRFVYDELDRLVQEHYADGSTVSRKYDKAGRLVEVEDSTSGVFTMFYDLEDALVASSGPTGTIRYVRDELERVQQRQVIGQPAVDYVYDPVGNLNSATMAELGVEYSYDALNRAARLTRVNGVTSDYSYDPVGRLLSIVHARGATNLMTLRYEYDAAGGRISQRSTAAQPLVTQPSGPTTFDDANRLIQRGATTYTYDDNGNLTSEVGSRGTTTYAWDSRNRLSRLVQPNGQTTEFTYDFTAMMIRQADYGPDANQTRAFTLDWLANVAVQQGTGGATFSVLTAQNIDTHLGTRSASGQADYGMTDAINTTVLTVDELGGVKSTVATEPFGETKVTGESFPFGFTGRTKVSESLYYYRARFYSAETGRFLSEDPAGKVGGSNSFRYAANNPVSNTDPSGLRECPAGSRLKWVRTQLGWVLICVVLGVDPPEPLPQPDPTPPGTEEPLPGGTPGPGGRGGKPDPPPPGEGIEIPSPSFSPDPMPPNRQFCPLPRLFLPGTPILGVRG